ncbi:hypothetical protein Taro_027033 [Colocasia esculenta]|uniref:Uncharacterized protein n=1 Tax=Colocasia esculenta TaxID=4460 RepID=A0A843VDG7_COLES|nr:hypothetical protein [Colocasia esculenta]
MVAPGESVATWFLWRHTWPSRHGRDGGGRRVLVAESGGVATAFLTNVTAVLSVRTVVSSGSSLAISRRFLVLVVLVLRWCCPVRAEYMLVVLGARRRWPFRREGPNGSALLLEPFRVSGSVGGDRENRVLGVGQGSGSQGRYSGCSTVGSGVDREDAAGEDGAGVLDNLGEAGLDGGEGAVEGADE